MKPMSYWAIDASDPLIIYISNIITGLGISHGVYEVHKWLKKREAFKEFFGFAFNSQWDMGYEHRTQPDQLFKPHKPVIKQFVGDFWTDFIKNVRGIESSNFRGIIDYSKNLTGLGGPGSTELSQRVLGYERRQRKIKLPLNFVPLSKEDREEKVTYYGEGIGFIREPNWRIHDSVKFDDFSLDPNISPIEEDVLIIHLLPNFLHEKAWITGKKILLFTGLMTPATLASHDIIWKDFDNIQRKFEDKGCDFGQLWYDIKQIKHPDDPLSLTGSRPGDWKLKFLRPIDSIRDIFKDTGMPFSKRYAEKA
ncbi:hypothetical protein ACFLQ6_09055 [Thermoproteota archaeon]